MRFREFLLEETPTQDKGNRAPWDIIRHTQRAEDLEAKAERASDAAEKAEKNQEEYLKRKEDRKKEDGDLNNIATHVVNNASGSRSPFR